jgi:hypothetical protein
MKITAMLSTVLLGSARAFAPRTAFARVGTQAYSSSSSLMANPKGR